MADDLVRVVTDESTWSFPAGLRQSKISEERASALGPNPAELQRRWTPLGQTENPKSINKHPQSDITTVPLTSTYILAPRNSTTHFPTPRRLRSPYLDVPPL